MRILHAISSINPAGGGPVEALKQLGLAARLQGHQVEVATLDSPGADYIGDFPLPVVPLGPPAFHYSYSARFIPWLRENASLYDAVVIDGIWQYHSFATWFALRKRQTPYVVFVHGMLDPWFKRKYPLKHLKKSLYWPFGDYRVLRDAAFVLFTCEEERLLARESFRLYSARERVVNCGTVPLTGDEGLQKRALLERFPSLRNKRILLFMGRIHPKKGCDLALRAFASAYGGDSRWCLVMAGPDQTGWKKSLTSLAAELQISERVVWTGMITGHLKTGLIRSAEALLLPSHQENFGIVVAEALAAGLPVLISNKVNIWREVEADGAGMVAPDDFAGTCSLLRSWERLTAEQRLAMRTNAAKSFRSRFEIGRASSNLLGVLEEAARRRSGLKVNGALQAAN